MLCNKHAGPPFQPQGMIIWTRMPVSCTGLHVHENSSAVTYMLSGVFFGPQLTTGCSIFASSPEVVECLDTVNRNTSVLPKSHIASTPFLTADMAAAVHTPPHMDGVPRKPSAPRAPIKKPSTATAAKKVPNGVAHRPATHPLNKAASVAGDNPATGGGVTSAYAIMASRIANRVAEMAESITFVER